MRENDPDAHAPEGAQADVVGFLASGAAFGGERPEQIDTHAARIFLAGERAWKLKRAVRYPYLDFSTPENRHAALATELELNRRTAPDLYLRLWPVTRDAAGALHLGGNGGGDVVDTVLEMRRFPQSALLSDMAQRGHLDEALMTRLAEILVAFHRAAESCPVGGDAAVRLRRIVEGNLQSMRRFPNILPAAESEALCRDQTERLAAFASLLVARAQAGRVRHGHGDLHLANIALINGEPTPFDCLEFDPEMARIDVLYDLAFLLMDLWHRGLRMEASLVLNRYLDLSAEDEDGVALLPLLMSIRASIRAHVSAAQSATAGDGKALEAVAYLELAGALMERRAVALLAIGGLSGTGKSTLARRLAADVGAAPGARIVRTDVIRKRLAGVAPETRLPPESYTRQSSAQVYAASLDLARDALRDGVSVVIDAVFADSDERRAVQALAAEMSATFVGLWLEASVSARIHRVEARTGDASDADTEIARRQAAPPTDSLGGWHRLLTDGGADRVATEAQALLSK